MRTIQEIKLLLDEIETRQARDVEDQDLDFKEWKYKSINLAVEAVIEMAICMANGGGGTVVFGVNDKLTGRAKALTGIPFEIDINRLKKAVYDSTDPKLTPHFEDLLIPEGTGRLLVMHVYPGLPPYTDTTGKGKIRVGTDCQPLTGTLRRRVMVETGETDYTSDEIPEDFSTLISPAALEQLRKVAQQERAPGDLLHLNDHDLLSALGVLRGLHITRAGILLAGKDEAIRQFVPGYLWTHFRMRTDTEYTDRMDGWDSLPSALLRITDRIMADNPITTVQYGMFHFEYRTYPEIVLREALMNAFSHTDYRLAGPILVRQYPIRLEISNPGGFIGGISPDNILHHPPVARNPHLVEALTRLRLVNRGNLGVPRMFQALLIEGKEAPIIEEQGESVKIIFISEAMSPAFRTFVAEESQRGRELRVDNLLILHFLLRHPEIDTTVAARICQRRETDAREILNEMEVRLSYLERGGAGRGTYWSLRPDLHRQLSGTEYSERSRRIDWEAAKTRVLSVLKQRSERGEPGLSNSDIRRITHLDRNQVLRLMRELASEDSKVLLSHEKGKSARYQYQQK